MTLDTGEEVRAHCTGTASLDVGDGVSLKYWLYRRDRASAFGADANAAERDPKPIRVIMIMGFACTGDCWLPVVKHLFKHSWERTVEVCTYDNRGIGESSSPSDKEMYTASTLANDACAIMDRLGWARCHVIGHSMGGMISTRLAAMAPDRVLSLSLLSVSGGGFQAVPFTWSTVKLGWKSMLAGASHHKRSVLDVKCHYSPETLKKQVGGRSMKEVLIEEYTAYKEGGSIQTRDETQHEVRSPKTHQVLQPEKQTGSASLILILKQNAYTKKQSVASPSSPKQKKQPEKQTVKE
eukprot:gene12395-15587_t